MTLDPGTPSFLSVTVGSDPIDDDLKIELNTAIPVLADCQFYTVTYTVAFAEYPSLTTSVGTFTFKLVDACIAATITGQTFTFPV